MIYTSHFSKIPILIENNLEPVAICGSVPYSYYGKWYRKLAPSWSIFSQYKDFGNKELYTQRFYTEILSKLNCEQCYLDLYNLCGENDNFVLICYENPNEFCHRHLVSEWFCKHGISCGEWISYDKFQTIF